MTPARQLFPTITDDVCRSYITTARLSVNAVALRIRQLLAPQLIVRCMYCSRDYKRVSCIREMHGKVSHGVCPNCIPRLHEEFGVRLATTATGRDIRGSAADKPGGGSILSEISRDPCGSTGLSVPAKDRLKGREIGLRNAAPQNNSGADVARK